MTTAFPLGRPAPLGATVLDGGTNFSLYSRTATGVELLLFDRDDAPAPSRTIALDPVKNRTYHYWLVSYNGKHNEANKEENRDGANDNKSWNCGVEGPTDDPAIEALRNRQVKNFLATTFLSLGVPMIVMGDEVRRTQHGNNNAYCHDDENNWFDWSLLQKHADVFRFLKVLLDRRMLRDVTHEEQRMSLTELIARADKRWHGVKQNQPDWGEHSHAIAFNAVLQKEKLEFHLILNAYWEPLEFELGAGKPWQRWIDTSLASPEDIRETNALAAVSGFTYQAGPRSVVTLVRSVE